MFLVVIIEGKTAADQTIAWCSRAIAEGTTNQFLWHRPTMDHISRQLWIGQHRTAKTDHILVTIANFMLGHRRKPFLKVTPAGSDQAEIGELAADSPGRPQMLSDTDQRIFRWCISVARWKNCRSLGVRAIIRTATRDIID